MRTDNSWLLAGLGNPGERYSRTWHNCGYMVLEILSQRHNIKIKRIRFKSLTGRGKVGKANCFLLKPTTYMNFSGEAIQAALAWTKVDPGHCLVIYDDIDLPMGQIRIRGNGGPGTHNGMRSVVEKLGRDDFPRLRIGIGSQLSSRKIADYVLSDVPVAQSEQFLKILNAAADAAELIVNSGVELAMSRFNGQVEQQQDGD